MKSQNRRENFMVEGSSAVSRNEAFRTPRKRTGENPAGKEWKDAAEREQVSTMKFIRYRNEQ